MTVMVVVTGDGSRVPRHGKAGGGRDGGDRRSTPAGRTMVMVVVTVVVTDNGNGGGEGGW